MRVLDLGCHDGYIASWVGRNLQDLHIDGIDANKQACEIFERRLQEHGIPGEAKVGLAEDAMMLFPAGSYDAVLAFELIEHVPDVDHFLAVCEGMLKEDGRVYLSTPDGVFGEGQNPHHLRVYRSIDLCELARRRGELEDARSGPDGITFLSYTPRRQRRNQREVAIYCGAGWKPWHPVNMETPGGLGGSETAAIRLAEALSKIGHTVTVYGDFIEQGLFGQVSLRHYEVYDPTEHVDLLIVSRIPEIIDAEPNADVTMLWCHDTDYGDRLTDERIAAYDKILALSHWHRRWLRQNHEAITDSKIAVVRNGIAPAYFTRAEQLIDADERIAHRAMFTSSPDRGLDVLLELWPEVRFHVPDAVLAYCYADVYQSVAASGQRPEVTEHHRRITELAEGLGDAVVNLGALAQPQLIEEMRRSGAWLHPSWNAPHGVPFMETFCIGAIESGLAGCRRVMADHGALPERSVETGMVGMLVHSREITDPPDRELWVQAIVEALTLDTPRTPVAPDAYSWAMAAKDFCVAGKIPAKV